MSLYKLFTSIYRSEIAQKVISALTADAHVCPGVQQQTPIVALMNRCRVLSYLWFSWGYLILQSRYLPFQISYCTFIIFQLSVTLVSLWWDQVKLWRKTQVYAQLWLYEYILCTNKIIQYINNTILVIRLKHENLQEIISRLLKAPTVTQTNLLRTGLSNLMFLL